jgi:hypothetical protein
MSALGWAVGLRLTAPHYGKTLLPAFVSAAVILNPAVMALPFEKDGRLPPFMSGTLFMD